MKYLLARAQRAVVARHLAANVALVFDFDGTLAPIVADPDAAQMRARTRALLRKVAVRFPCAVISGRSRDDVTRRLAGCGIEWIVGNHGAEWGWAPLDGRSIEGLVLDWQRTLAPRLAAIDGVVIEDKRYSLAIHFRKSRQKKRAQSAIAEAVVGLESARVRLGKQVVNVVPRGAPHKGIALQQVRSLVNCDTAIYVGDDTTDEDVFALDEPGQLLGVRIGASDDSQAAYYLDGQGEIDAFLRLVLEARGGASLRDARATG
jgi:trehalose 6-phosphate phosphatase